MTLGRLQMGARYSYKWSEYFPVQHKYFKNITCLPISGYRNHSDSLILTKLRFLCDSAIPVAIPVAILRFLCDSSCDSELGLRFRDPSDSTILRPHLQQPKKTQTCCSQNDACLVGKMTAPLVRVFCTHLEPPNCHIAKKQNVSRFRRIWDFPE